MNHPVSLIARLVIGGCLLPIGAGCEIDGESEWPRRRRSDTVRYPSEYPRETRRPAGERMTRTLPRDADRLASGRGNIAIEQAPRDGTVYVIDETDGAVIWTQEVRRGNSFQIFPERGYVNVNSKREAEVGFPRGHEFSLYFKQK